MGRPQNISSNIGLDAVAAWALNGPTDSLTLRLTGRRAFLAQLLGTARCVLGRPLLLYIGTLLVLEVERLVDSPVAVYQAEAVADDYVTPIAWRWAQSAHQFWWGRLRAVLQIGIDYRSDLKATV